MYSNVPKKDVLKRSMDNGMMDTLTRDFAKIREMSPCTPNILNTNSFFS